MKKKKNVKKKNPAPPANAGLIPGQGPKIPHASQPGKSPSKNFLQKLQHLGGQRETCLHEQIWFIYVCKCLLFTRDAHTCCCYSLKMGNIITRTWRKRWQVKWLAPNHKAGKSLPWSMNSGATLMKVSLCARDWYPSAQWVSVYLLSTYYVPGTGEYSS